MNDNTWFWCKGSEFNPIEGKLRHDMHCWISIHALAYTCLVDGAKVSLNNLVRFLAILEAVMTGEL